MLQIRPMTPDDAESARTFVNGWFSVYRDHLDYDSGVWNALRHSLWRHGDLSLWATWDGQPAGMVMAGRRAVTFDGQRLVSAHVGPVAVNPFFRRKGVARGLIRSLQDHAASAGVDLLSLMAQEIYPFHKLYTATGFRLVERFQPLGAQFGDLQVPDWADPVPVDRWDAVRPASQAREGALTEQPPASRFLEGNPDVPVKAFHWKGAGVLVALWPVLVRVGSTRERVWSCQVVDAFGTGQALGLVTATALAWARRHGCEGAYLMPTVGSVPDGFSTEGAPWVHRYCKGVSAAGTSAVEQATRYDQACPAP